MAQELFTFKQGESKLLIVEIRDAEDATVDMSTANIIKAELYIKGKDSNRVKFALDPAEGETALEIGDENYLLKIPVDREESKLLDAGVLMVDVLGVFPSTVMPDGDEAKEFAPIKVGQLGKGYLKDSEL